MHYIAMIIPPGSLYNATNSALSTVDYMAMMLPVAIFSRRDALRLHDLQHHCNQVLPSINIMQPLLLIQRNAIIDAEATLANISQIFRKILDE